MTATSYNDISTANSVKLLKTFSMYNEYIMLYTEIDSHIEKGDRVYITVVGDVGDLSQDSIILDNLYSSNIDTLYNDTLQGYSVIFVDKTKNAIVINKKVSDITSSDDISGFTIENQYISKISIHNIIVDKCTINGATIKYGIINNTKNDGDVNWIQGNIFGGEIYNTTLDNKYDNSYITLKKFESMSYVFTANNTEIGLSDGYSYFYNVIIQDSIITSGNFTDCDLQNTNDFFIDGGNFNNCNYVEYHINNGYHKNIIDLDYCVWNNGYFDCPETGYSFNLDYWYNGTFVNGLFGGTKGQNCYKPIWVNGIFNNGIFDSYKWENGEFNNGIFGANGKIGNKTPNTSYDAYESHLGITKRRGDGNLLNPNDSNNIYEYTTFLNGIINGGFFIRTKISNATIGNGTIVDSTILNIKNLGGLLIDCSIKTGELLGGFIRSNNLSFVINNCTISNTDINIYIKDEISLNKYKNDSEIVKAYINAYSLYFRNDTYIFINNCSLISPKLHISKENTNRIFINKQQSIKGGEYENINFYFPQIIEGGDFKYSTIGYKKDSIGNNIIPNSVFCSVRPVRILIDNNGAENAVYTMFEYSNNNQRPFFPPTNINITLENIEVNLYGCIYTKLENNGTGNNGMFDVLKLNVLNNSNKYDPRKYNDVTEKYDNIESYSDNYVILDMLYKDFMFGDFCVLYHSDSGIIGENDKYTITGGKFEKCELMGLDNNSRITIDGGIFDNTNFNGYIKIEKCNFNGGIISGNSNEWNGGNFNSGTFGEHSDSDINYELRLYNGPHSYLSKIGDTYASVDTFTGEMMLQNIYPLIIRREYTNNNNFDSIGKLHDEEYQEYYLDIWNESGIDFTGTTTGISNEEPWKDNIINSENYMIVPSHFVFVIKNTSSIEHQNMLSFIQRSNDISIYDTIAGKTFNELYNEKYKSNIGDIPVNDFNTQYVGYYINNRTYSIAFVFKFDKIEELYNNTLNKNQQWFDNIFNDYSLYYKNVWSEANAGYFVRPIPIYNKITEVVYPELSITEDYDNYPIPSNKYYNNMDLPAPWHFDNNGKLWLPLHQGSAKNYYSDYKRILTDYSKKYFRSTSDILPYDYYNFKKNTKSSFNTALPFNKKTKKDYITDSIETNVDITDYININTIGSKELLKIDGNKLWLYEGGWEKFVDMPFNFKINNIDNIQESWLYIDQYFGISLNELKNAKDGQKFLHVVSHGENLMNDYDGPCRILNYDNVMGDNFLYKVKIDKKISNNYGHAFIVDSNNFIFDNSNKIIQIINYDKNTYNIKTGGYLYIYTTDDNGKVVNRGKVTIFSDGTLVGTTMHIKISENISITTPSNSNFVYGLDMWVIDESNTPNSSATSVSRIDINTSNTRLNNSFSNSVVVPSNEITNKWIAGDPLYVYSQGLNTTFSPSIKYIYPNDYVQGKIVKIKNIKENYDSMYLYDTIFDYTTNKEADKVNVYLYDSINIPNYNKTWLKDTMSINVIGNSIDFDTNYRLLDGQPKLTGTVIRYKNMFSFKKTTNMFKINADTNITGYADTIIKMSNNKDFVEIHDENAVALLSGVYESKGYSFIMIESFTKMHISQSPLVGFSVYSLRTLPIYYKSSAFTSIIDKDRGNYIEFSKTLNNKVLTSAFRITSSDSNTIVTIRCDLRDTFYGQTMNLSKYKKQKITIIGKFNGNYTYYSNCTINDVRPINSYEADVDIILNQDINILSKVEFGYFYITEEMTEGLCYRYFTTNKSGIEITESDNYHWNSGDPSKIIKYSPKEILLRLNTQVRTTEEFFERQAGIFISSKYNLNNDEKINADIFNDGNFYSGDFYGDWNNGDWFAGSNSFKGNNFFNKQAGLDFTKAPERKESTIKNFTEVINSLIKRGEYFMYPPWTSKERQIVVTPKITRSDEY